MKFSTAASLAALAAQQVAAHATFQALWVGTTDYITDTKHAGTCLRTPNSNSPIQDVTVTEMRCNYNQGAVAGKCPVAAGGTVTVEMHQQPGDRTCTQPAIGGQHWGPVIVYMSKVADSSTADGSAGWFKVFESGWTKLPGSTRGDDDYWGVKELEKCCGRMNVKIPATIPPGDYLLRAEVIALHAATVSGGAQFYMSCYQLTVTGGGSANPATVLFPGAYKATDPGIGLSIHGNMTSYIVPGPTIVAGGSSKVPGPSATCVGVETGTAPGPAPTATSTRAVTTSSAQAVTTSPGGTTLRTSATTTRTAAQPTTTSASGGGLCSVAKYGQCGGNSYTGCTSCAAGSTCQAVSPPYYSQCL